MSEFEQTPQPQKTYDDEVNEAIEIARAAGPLPPKEDEALQSAIRASQAIVEDPDRYMSQQEKIAPVETPRRKLSGKDAAWGLAAAGAIVAGAAGINSLSGGEDNANRGEVDQTIHSITISPDANLRLDPKVGDEVTGPNVALQPGAEVTIDANHDVRVLEGTNNGTWYGVEVEDVAAKIPDAENIHDKDGIVWVNEQGVEAVDKDLTAEANK